MEKQIQQKFEEILTGLGFLFHDDELSCHYTTKSDLIELMEFAFNLGLDVAAENAEADFNCITENAEIQIHKLIMNNELECYVLRGSILKHKL